MRLFVMSSLMNSSGGLIAHTPLFEMLMACHIASIALKGNPAI